MEEVILVDKDDKEVGVEEKLAAHQSGKLHRALSVLLFNDAGEWLVQQRAHHKYHSPGLLSNTCCSHPRPGETSMDAAIRRLKEEMGIVCSLTPLFTFQYRCEFENDLIEHELDHVFVGLFNGEPVANPQEVASWKWISTEDLFHEFETFPDKYTFWFKIIAKKMKEMGSLYAI